MHFANDVRNFVWFIRSTGRRTWIDKVLKDKSYESSHKPNHEAPKCSLKESYHFELHDNIVVVLHSSIGRYTPNVSDLFIYSLPGNSKYIDSAYRW